jgi:LPXTG-motif cell wall-anchored protein
MKLIKVLAAIGSLALLALMLTPGLKADNDVWNQKTTLTFSQPFEIPGGKVLSAGTYVFKLLDSRYDRDIVQIFSEDQTHLYATILAIPNHRLQAPENTTMNFEERAAGSPQAIKAWFHPGETWGHEFVYPKQKAIELAQLANEPVPSVSAEVAPEMNAPAPTGKEESVVALEKAPLTAEAPSGEELPIAQAFAPEVASLPKTASSMPLFGLVGILSLAAGFGLLIVARKVS